MVVVLVAMENASRTVTMIARMNIARRECCINTQSQIAYDSNPWQWYLTY
jgi:hypothetical protein